MDPRAEAQATSSASRQIDTLCPAPTNRCSMARLATCSAASHVLQMREERVIVVGAGAAGLVAARALARAGVPVDLIEASERVGGRIITLHDPEWPMAVELGAEFVHGRPESIRRLLDEAGLTLRPIDDRHHYPPALGASSASERRARSKPLRELPNLWQQMSELLSRVDPEGPDLSASAFAEREQLAGERRAQFELFVRGFHAAPLADVSMQSLRGDLGASDDDGGNEMTSQYRVDGGYGRLIGWLSRGFHDSGGRVQTGSIVRRVSWRRGHVAADVEQEGKLLRLFGRALLVTVPVGVLRAPAEQGIVFDPELEQKREPLARLGMAQVEKIVLRFRARFYDESVAPAFEFLHDPRSTFQTFWRETRDGLHQMTAWAGDVRAADAAALRTEAGAVELALTTLADLLGVDPARARQCLVAHHRHDFHRDPFASGAYSYVRPSGKAARSLLAQPLDGTLFFAGEATDEESPATVAGAIQSGSRAARELLQQLAA
jgi:monoamine oxidase